MSELTTDMSQIHSNMSIENLFLELCLCWDPLLQKVISCASSYFYDQGTQLCFCRLSIRIWGFIDSLSWCLDFDDDDSSSKSRHPCESSNNKIKDVDFLDKRLLARLNRLKNYLQTRIGRQLSSECTGVNTRVIPKTKQLVLLWVPFTQIPIFIVSVARYFKL